MILLNLNLTLLLWRINRAEQKMLIDGKYQMVGNAHPEDFVFQFQRKLKPSYRKFRTD